MTNPRPLTVAGPGPAANNPASAPAYAVVTPVYNAAKTLRPMIEALLSLSPPPRAIYMVDDGSTDNSIEIIKGYSGVTSVALGVNRGPGHARNVGAQMAATELLLMIDSDCYIDSEGFSRAYERMTSAPNLAGIMGVPVRETPPGPFAGMFKNYWYHLEFKAWGDPPRTLYGSCFLMRREAYLSVGGFDASFGRIPCEDAEFYFRLVQAGHVFERRMDFTFVHDKSMTLRQLIRTSFERSVSIIQNFHGKLGRPGAPWTLREKAMWALEIGSGAAAAIGLPLALGAVLSLSLATGALSPPTRELAELVALAWLVSVVMFFVSIRDKLTFALRDKGLPFAAGAFMCRMLEMPGVALGIVWGSLHRRPIPPDVQAYHQRSGISE